MSFLIDGDGEVVYTQGENQDGVEGFFLMTFFLKIHGLCERASERLPPFPAIQLGFLTVNEYEREDEESGKGKQRTREIKD